MVTKEEFYLPSSDGKSRLYCRNWRPEGRVKASLSICHGMIEHINRYDEFAVMLAEHQIAVTGHDHLGHGQTSAQEDWGYFADDRGFACVVKDMHRAALRTRNLYPGVPHLMLGHSMGSFFLRRYITVYGEEPDGGIIVGTGDQPLLMLAAAKLAAGLTGICRGGRYRSPLLHELVLGNYSRSFRPVSTPNDWLSKDEAWVQKHEEDPSCSFHFTCKAYIDFFDVMLDLKLHRQFDRIPRDLPLCLISGQDDPVGGAGRGVERVYREFSRIGMRDIDLKLYPTDRHEVLFEVDREAVWADLLSWILERVG